MALDSLDIELHTGEVLALLGPNGAGKTTTFRMSCGLIAPTKGAVFLNGTDVTRFPTPVSLIN